jgi:flagellar biosynthesis/type III secretory pathway protein FliH
MKKMDLYKTNVIKAKEVINSGKAIPVSCTSLGEDYSDDGSVIDEYGEKQTQLSEQDRRNLEIEKHVKKVNEDFYKKGLSDGIEFQKKEALPALTAVATIEKKEEQIVMLAIAIAEKIINQEVATRKEIILGVLKGALKNIAETDGMKIRINPQDFRYMMEIKKDFIQSFDGIRNVVFEEDASIKRGGAIVETMFGEVDARLESQLQEIKAAMLHQ